MKNLLATLDKTILNLLKEIGRQGDASHLKVYVVGGFVRDVLLKTPNLDIDIVVEGDALRFARAFVYGRECSLTAFEKFGTAAVSFSKGLSVDFATARKEVYPFPGSLPVVSTGTLREDFFRRDFKINAMAISLNAETFGYLVDEFAGLEDLRHKKISVLHNQSFIDDPTRILRAVRFEKRLNFKIDLQTLRLLKSALSKKVFKTVTPERYFEEFRKMLSESIPEKPLLRLAELGGLEFLQFDPKKISSVLRLINKIKTEKNKFKNASFKEVEGWLMNLMAISEAIPQNVLTQLVKRFNLKKDEQKTILSVHETGQYLQRLEKVQTPSLIYQVLTGLNSSTLLFLLAKANFSTYRKIKNFIFLYADIKPSLTGDDLIKLGVPRGEIMGEILNKILYDKVNGTIKTKKDELRRAMQWKSF